MTPERRSFTLDSTLETVDNAEQAASEIAAENGFGEEEVMLEYFVHLDSEDPPPDLVLAVAEVPDTLVPERISLDDLPANWRETPPPPSLSRFGDELVEAGRNFALVVPSALAPPEFNWLLNPAHPDFRKLVIRDLELLDYHQRLSKPRSRKHR